jgi:hypothetical protein
MIEIKEKDKEIELRRAEAIEVKSNKTETIEYLGQKHRKKTTRERLEYDLEKTEQRKIRMCPLCSSTNIYKNKCMVCGQIFI